jgi:hypothetical protein
MALLHRAAPAHSVLAPLALGLYALLVGSVYLVPFLFTQEAQQNDAFLTNLFLGPLCGLFGILLLLIGVSVARLRTPRWVWDRALVLAAAGAGLVSAGYALFGGRFYAFGETASHLPPYLNGPVLALSGLVGVIVVVLGWVWRFR